MIFICNGFFLLKSQVKWKRLSGMQKVSKTLPGLNDLATLYTGVIHEIYLLDIHLLLAITIVVSDVVLLKERLEWE